MANEKNLTSGKPFSVLWRFTLPVIGGNLFQLFYTLADSVIVGKTLGANALAAVGSTTIIIYMVLCFIQGFTGGFGIRLGQMCGAGKEKGMKRSATVSWILSLAFTLILTGACCLLAHPILRWMQTPQEIYQDAYDYMLVIFLGTGATIFYNIISNMLRALCDSRTSLIFLVLSSLLNIVLDILFIVPLQMGVAGAAWATVLSQLVSALLCTAVGLRRFPVLWPGKLSAARLRSEVLALLRIGFPMGFQMSVMCIGQLAMQAAVNHLGPEAIAGYTAATKVDQLSVLMNNAFGIALSSYVAQNYGAGLFGRIREGIRASLLQTEAANLAMCALLVLGRNLVTPLFIDNPTPAIVSYANGYLLAVAPFYLFLGLLLVYRTAVQSMGNTWAPFAACMAELILRIAGTAGLSKLLGYTGICLSSPMAWIGATALLIPVYRLEMKKGR